MKVSSASTIPRSLLAPLSTARRKRWRQREGGAHSDATAVRRGVHRVAIGQAFAERQPHLLAVQAGPRRAGQGTEGLAAALAAVALQPPCRAIGHRSGRAAAGAASILAHSQFDCRQRRFTDRPARQNLHRLCFLRRAQPVDHAQPSLKFLSVHRPDPPAFPPFCLRSIRYANRASLFDCRAGQRRSGRSPANFRCIS